MDDEQGRHGRITIRKKKEEQSEDGVPLPVGPGPGPPLALRPTSRARVCSSLTASRRVSGTRKYFIFFFFTVPRRHHTNRGTITMRWDDRTRDGDGLAHRTTTDVALLELPKSITVRAGLIHFAQGDIHKVVAVDEMAVERLAVFEFYKLGRGVSVIRAGTRHRAV